MKGTRSCILFIAGLWVPWLLQAGWAAEFSSHPKSDHPRTDAPFVRFIEKSLGTDWYGIYLQGKKVGYLKSTSGREKEPDGTVYKIQLSGFMQNPSRIETGGIKINTVSTFRSQPPFSMIYFMDRMIEKGDIAETRIIKTAKGYEARITQGGETSTHMIGTFEYGLKDYTAVQRWVTRNPKEGDEIKYLHFNSETLAMEEQTSRIAGIHKTTVSGVETSCYAVTTTGLNGLEVQEVFVADGRPYRLIMGGVFECRLESKSSATRMGIPFGSMVKDTVPVNRPLGAAETVTLLKLAIDKKSGSMFDNASGQSVTHNPADDSVIVTLNAGGGHHIKATHEEIENNLAAGTRIPALRSKIIQLARSAVGDAKTPARKVNRLVHFVYQYIEDDDTANPLTLSAIVAKRKGDCIEHARLFSAMARAVGIPCRTVRGLAYLGDESQAFGLHAWNEVVIHGTWVPVDPTWGQTSVDATHIRFSTTVPEEWRILAALSKMKIEVFHVEHAK